MSFCPKCGNQIDENMAFCPHCGTPLKAASPGPAPSSPPYPPRNEKAEKNEKQEKHEKDQQGEKNEKAERGFVGYLIGGLILITFGLFAILNLTGYFTTGDSWAVMLLIIGVIIIVGAIYVATTARRRNPQTGLD